MAPSSLEPVASNVQSRSVQAKEKLAVGGWSGAGALPPVQEERVAVHHLHALHVGV